MTLLLRIPLHNFLTIKIHLFCGEFTDVLQKRPTFKFTVENFTYPNLTRCRISRWNVHLGVSVVKELTATVTECADGTALCVFSAEYVALLCTSGYSNIQSMAVYRNYTLCWKTMSNFMICQLLSILSIKFAPLNLYSPVPHNQHLQWPIPALPVNCLTTSVCTWRLTVMFVGVLCIASLNPKALVLKQSGLLIERH